MADSKVKGIAGNFSMPNVIYLDYNATTPVDPAAAQAMLPVMYGNYGNASSTHKHGMAAKKLVEKARSQIANLLGCQDDEVIFTSGGTESNNYAIKGVAWANQNHRKQIITSAIEHPAVLEVCKWLGQRGFKVTILPVDENGLVDPNELEKELSDNTLLVSIMHANNEVGTIQPIRELARLTHEYGALFHTDAAQTTGKIPVQVNELEVDLLSIAGHKVYAPAGIGVLYIRNNTCLEKLMQGAGHEAGRRPGTENLLEIAGLGAACEIAGKDLQKNIARYKSTRDQLENGLLNELGHEHMHINGHPEKRLPNTSSISFYGIEANRLLENISSTISASAGAACHAGDVHISAVLQAMKVPMEWAKGTLRFSTGRGTTSEQIDRVIEKVTQTIKKLS